MQVLLADHSATLGNPLFLIKARMQAYSPFLPVGAQHHYTSSVHALSSVVKAEGIKGLGRGVSAAMLRTAMVSYTFPWQSLVVVHPVLPYVQGSSVQLPSYNYAKSVIVRNGWLGENSYWTYLWSSSVSGICVVRIRLASSGNQGHTLNRLMRSDE
jgi:solute carrier family 25 protein 34/35